MIIKRVSIGNEKEAYVENRFSKGINIISSDDNNKGKTIVIQSMMYALGNEPLFPSSLNFKEYYHTVEFTIDNHDVSICRKDKSFVVSFRGSINIFDSTSEFKYYMHKVIFPFPIIIKDGYEKLVDPLLFYQLFFLGQDKKDTSDIILNGYYKKKDFINMLYSVYNIPLGYSDDFDEDIGIKLKELKSTKKELLKKHKILKSAFGSMQVASMVNDKTKFEEKLSKVEKIKKKIVELGNNRNKLVARLTKNDIILKELRSLNQTMLAGKIHCLNCESEDIGYSTADDSYTFDISSKSIRQQILESIEDKINSYKEDIQFGTDEINGYQRKLKELLKDDDFSIESLLIHKKDILDSEDADEKIMDLDSKISEIELILEGRKVEDSSGINTKKELLDELLLSMNDFYKYIDNDSVDSFSELFTLRNMVHSGVEGTEFYLSKLYALLVVIRHKFPIIMDAFRAGELSSNKEKLVIERFNEFDNQVIFTVTLKDEEIGKYDNMKDINHINYVGHKAYKLLTDRYVDEFWAYNNRFLITR